MKTLAEVARHFGVSYDTVRKEWRKQGMPGKPGRYDLVAIEQWKRLRLREPLAVDEAEAAGEVETELKLLRRKRAAEARIKEAEARKREFDERVRAGEVLDKATVSQIYAQLIITAKQRFGQIPESCMPLWPKSHRVEWAEELRRMIDNVLKEMADWRPDEAKGNG